MIFWKQNVRMQFQKRLVQRIWLALEDDFRTLGAIQLSSFDLGGDSHRVRELTCLKLEVSSKLVGLPDTGVGPIQGLNCGAEKWRRPEGRF